MRNVSEGSRAKRKRRRFFSNIFVIFLLIIAFIQVKDKLFPAIKNIVIKNSSPFNDYVLADKDTLINENQPTEGSNNGPINVDNNKAGVDNEQIDQEIIKKKEMLKNSVYINEEGLKVVNNPDDILVLVNKERNLPSDYKPDDLIIPNVRFSFEGHDQKRYLRKEAATALEELFEEAEKEGVIFYADSGYRSYERQEFLFNYRAERDGVEKANKLTARPGQSEHQTGLAMDVTSQSVNLSLESSFGETTEGIWLKENAHRFGFIIRYLKDKTDITGYSYEPWHIRYVGTDVAKEIYENNITLEEYLGFEYSLE